MKIYLPILVGMLFILVARGQENSANWQVGAAPYGGFILPHHNDIAYLIDGHVTGFELEVSKTSDGRKDWHHAFNFPIWGFTFSGYDLSSPFLGHAVAGKVFVDLPMFTPRWVFLKLGVGVVYLEKPFDKDKNFNNSAVGSHVNSALQIGIFGRIRLSSKFVLKPGIDIHHFSNGALKLPNSGLNVAMIRLMIEFNPAPLTLPQRKSADKIREKDQWFAGISGGMKQTYPIGGPEYPVVNIFGFYQKRVSAKSSLGGELGLNYNASLEYRIGDDNRSSGSRGDNYRYYAAALYQLHFGKFGIRFQAGSYIAPRFKDDGMLFLRYHLLYNFNRFQIFTGLKSHYARADNVELGIAYRVK